MIFLVILLAALAAIALVSLGASWWFPRITFVKKLKASAKAIDAEVVETLPAGLTVKKIRTHDELGAKIVVAHCLVGMSDDVERKLTRGVLLGLVATILIQTGIGIYTISGLDPAKITAASQALDAVAAQTARLYLVPLATTVLALLYALIALFFFDEQTYKYRGVMN